MCALGLNLLLDSVDKGQVSGGGGAVGVQ